MKKNIIFILLLIVISCFCGCKKATRGEVKSVTEEITRIIEKKATKKLQKAISVLPQKSQKYLKKALAENEALLKFFNKNGDFVSTWEYLRTHGMIEKDCLNPKVLKCFVYANKYASTNGGQKLENWMYKRVSEGLYEVRTKKKDVKLATIDLSKLQVKIHGDPNNAFTQIKPLPNFTYDINGSQYVIDAKGRVKKSSFTIEEIPVLGKRTEAEKQAQRNMNRSKGSKRVDGTTDLDDTAGHLLSRQYGGSSNMVNMVPMNGPGVNQGIYNTLEEKIWKPAVLAGKKVKVDVEMIYPKVGQTDRPEFFKIVYKIDGEIKELLIPNSIDALQYESILFEGIGMAA